MTRLQFIASLFLAPFAAFKGKKQNKGNVWIFCVWHDNPISFFGQMHAKWQTIQWILAGDGKSALNPIALMPKGYNIVKEPDIHRAVPLKPKFEIVRHDGNGDIELLTRAELLEQGLI